MSAGTASGPLSPAVGGDICRSSCWSAWWAGSPWAAIAAGRRTQSSFPAYLASTNPSDFGAITGVINPLIGSTLGYNPKLLHTIARLPHVRTVGSASGLNVIPVGPHGNPINVAGSLLPRGTDWGVTTATASTRTG